MSNIALLYVNILETSTVSVQNENPDYPKWRLHDRDIGKKFYGGSIESPFLIKADQGSVYQRDVNTLIIPAGHNLAGELLGLKYGPDNVSYTDAVSAWTGVAGLIVKEFTVQNAQWWRFSIDNPAAIPQMQELWLGSRATYIDVIAWGYQEGRQGNVARTDSLSGRPHFLQNGEDRKYRNYMCKCYSSSVRDSLESFFSYSRGKPFWLQDLDGEWYFMSLVDPNIGPFDRPGLNRFDLQLEMIEVLA